MLGVFENERDNERKVREESEKKIEEKREEKREKTRTSVKYGLNLGRVRSVVYRTDVAPDPRPRDPLPLGVRCPPSRLA